MTTGLYTDPHTFTSFSELNTKQLYGDIASRETAFDFEAVDGLIGDPDAVLSKLGVGDEVFADILTDGHLTSVIQTRKIGTLKKTFSFDPGTNQDGEVDDNSQVICDQLNDDFKSFPLQDIVSAILDAVLYGISPLELYFSPIDSRIKLDKIESKPSRWFGFDKHNSPRFIAVGEEVEGVELPYGKFVFARHYQTYDNPYGLKLLSRCYWPVVFKRGGMKFWVTFMEKYGSPFLVGHYTRGTSPAEQSKMLSDLVAMVSNAVAVVPEDNRIEVVDGKGGKGGSGVDVFDAMRQAMESELSKIILGQTLTTESGDKGSYGLGKVQAGVLEDYQAADTQMVKRTFNEISRIYTEINSAGAIPPVCVTEEQDPANAEFADRDKTLLESGRLRFTKSYYQRRYFFRDDDIEIVEQDEQETTQDGQPDEYSETSSKTASLGDVDSEADKILPSAVIIFDGIKEAVISAVALDNGIDIIDKESVDKLSVDLSGFIKLLDDTTKKALEAGAAKVDLEVSIDFAEGDSYAGVFDGQPFGEAIISFTARNFEIAGELEDEIKEIVKSALLQTMEDGGNLETFRHQVADLLTTTLSMSRIDTIFRTNMHVAYQSGRLIQMEQPHIVSARPYWRYVATRDGVTRPAHKRMHGKVFRYDNPIWDKWYPPNGFNCRCSVVTLSEREVLRDGYEIETRDISGDTLQVQTETGVQTVALLPDDGWDHKPI